MSVAPTDVGRSETGKTTMKHTTRCSDLERDHQSAKSKLAHVLQRVASNYKCSSCVLAFRQKTYMHVIATCRSGHSVIEKDIPLIDEEEFQLFHHHIRRPIPIIIDDAADDHRLKGDPFVVADPHVRFYAAAPIYSASQDCQGTLCIIDDKPKTCFSLKEADFLCGCATAVARILQLQG
eukprot:TRINITY_DN10107_c0_g1_i1.p1 TRINITY_DN10107_c0_g1~~TRINITY_DN10107_c0_g1_i1.p1  ORF type:complete len:190 (-),score=21.51 TRINITY_DN10107_c0_g1_i1:85-621(-)